MTVQQIRSDLEIGPFGIPFLACQKFGHQQAGHRQSHVQSQLIRINQPRRSGSLLLARLPLVRAVQLERKILSSPKRVLVRDTERQSRPQEVIGLRGDTQLTLHFHWQIIHGVYSHVQFAQICRIHRNDLQVCVLKNAQPSQLRLRLALPRQRKEVARTQLHAALYHFRAQIQRLVVVNGHAMQMKGIPRFLLHVVAQNQAHLSHTARHQGQLRHSGL